MIDKYKDSIVKLLSTNGPMGVNELQKALDVPLSSLQYYLTKQQSFFKKTGDRKWDLPTNVESEVKSNTLSLMASSVENAVLLSQAQLAELQISFENIRTLADSLRKNVNSVFIQPTAELPEYLQHPSLSEIIDSVTNLPKVIKSKMSTIPDDYKGVLNNVDWLRLITELGTIFFKDEISTDIINVLVHGAELPETVLTYLKDYQNE